LKIPLRDNFSKLPKEISKDIKVDNTFNIFTFKYDLGNFEDNHFSIYGFNNLSSLKVNIQQFKKMKEQVKNNFMTMDEQLKKQGLSKFKPTIFKVLKNFFSIF